MYVFKQKDSPTTSEFFDTEEEALKEAVEILREALRTYKD